MRQHSGEQSGLVTLNFDILTLKVVFESRVTWATSVPILTFKRVGRVCQHQLSFSLVIVFTTEITF